MEDEDQVSRKFFDFYQGRLNPKISILSYFDLYLDSELLSSLFIFSFQK